MYVGKRLIPAPHGHLEAIYRPRSERAARVALLLHPHPLFGGTMHNPVVFRAARALEEAGLETLRINFRGVGESTATHDQGLGEIDDARAALDFLLEHQPRARDVVVAGYSFGAGVGLRFGCAEPRVTRMIAIGTPAAMIDVSLLRACAKPKLFVHGERDDVAPLASLRALLDHDGATLCELRTIPGAGHFFEMGTDELEEAIRSFAAAATTSR